MPTYEYQCGECGFLFERFQSITAAPVTECPECGGMVKRLLGTGTGFVMKGSAAAAVREGGWDGPSCGRAEPCCGRSEPCEDKPCH